MTRLPFPSRALALAIVLALAVPACEAPSAPLNVATSIWPGFAPLYLAEDLGYLRPGDARLHQLPTSTSVIDAFKSDGIDVAALTLDEVLLVAEDLHDLRIVLVTDRSNGADAILATATVAGLADIRGKRVGVENRATGGYLLTRALEKARLSPADVRVVPLGIDQQQQALLSGRVDAVVTREPARTAMVGSGAHVIFDSSDIPGEIVDVLVARASASSSNKAKVEALRNSWYRALDYERTRPVDAVVRMARIEGLPPSVMRGSLEGIVLEDRGANARLLVGPRPALLPVAERMERTMLRSGLLRKGVDVGLLFGVGSTRAAP